MPCGIIQFLSHFQHTITLVNKEVLRLFGLETGSQRLGNPIVLLLYPENSKQYLALLEQALSEERNVPFEMPVHHATKTFFWIGGVMHNVTADSGECLVQAVFYKEDKGCCPERRHECVFDQAH